jgi:hypothetical protein
MAEPPVLPSGGPTREEIAKIEIGNTAVSPSVARGLTAFFLISIVLVPVVEIVVPRFAGESTPTVWSKLAAIPSEMSAAVQSEVSRGHASLWKRALAANRAALSGLTGFENALEDESVLGRTLRPPAQALLSGWLGAGNERVYVGRRGEDGARWLFYRPDLEYLTGRGFLDAHTMRRRIVSASEWSAPPQPDPRPAIVAFHRWLAARGVSLVVVPTPVKPGVHPDKLIASYPADRGIAQNASYAEFVESLNREGVPLFDPSTVLSDARRTGAQYLATDTHWRPEAMELVVQALAAFVNQRVQLPSSAGAGHRIEERELSNEGDTAAMLDLPRGQQLYPRERVVVNRVLNGDGSPWQSDRGADVLVLGDSFANIYSLASMGWGESAGFVEHLSFTLGRPIDRIVQNDNGAFATRELLAAAGPDRLTGKRVVIWQFAARELASGNWKVIK